MSAEVDEVERAQDAGDLDEVHVARGADEDGDVVDFGTVEVQPEVGDWVSGLGACGGRRIRVDEVLPSGGVVGGDDGAHRFRGVEGRTRIVIGVYGDAVEGRRGSLGLGVAVVDEAASEFEHVAIEGDGEVRGGLVRQFTKGLRDSGGLLGSCSDGEGESDEEESGERMLHLFVASLRRP